MMGIKHYPLFTSSGVHGNAPVEWYGKDPIDGAVGNWAKAPVGSTYHYKPSESAYTTYRKVVSNDLTSDWVVIDGMFAARVSVADFTDGGSTAGTYVLPFTIPAGSTVLATYVRNVVGFAGDTSATILVGETTTPDTDRYMTSTPSVFATAANVAVGVPSGTAYHAAAISTVTVTVTTAADFTACKTNGAGRATIIIFYR